MKTRREHSLAVARSAFSLSALIWDNMRRGGLSVLILALSALHLPVFAPSALAVSPAEGKSGSYQQWSLRVDKVDTGDVSLDPSFESPSARNLWGRFLTSGNPASVSCLPSSGNRHGVLIY